MPIYDLSYRHWDGPLRGTGSRWSVIAEAGVRLPLGRRRFIFLLVLCWMPFFIEAFLLYLHFVRQLTIGFDIGPWFFQQAFFWQTLPLVLMTIYVGAGLISSDLSANALPLYFSKPITRTDYILGKFAVIAFYPREPIDIISPEQVT